MIEKKQYSLQIKMILWSILVMNILIFFLAGIFGGSIGYAMAFRFHTWFALIMTTILLIVLGALLFVDFLVYKLYQKH